jgi:HPt (histidine-containing phosphotransfer) domain-containing protein
LKGVAGNLSADRLQIAATNLETALKNQDPAAADSLLDLLESALAEVCTSATLLAEPAAHETGSVSGPSADIGALLGELQHLLEIHSLDVNTPLNQLFGLILQGDERIQLEALADAAQRLDYQQALVVLHTLAEKTGACKENL